MSNHNATHELCATRLSSISKGYNSVIIVIHNELTVGVSRNQYEEHFYKVVSQVGSLHIIAMQAFSLSACG